MSIFVPGLELSRLFYGDVVQPILNHEFPNLQYSAALLGSGSEVLGFDTEMSTDHDWGPRLSIYLTECDHQRYRELIKETMHRNLPQAFRGYLTRFQSPSDQDSAYDHHVSVTTFRGFLLEYLDFDLVGPIEPSDWFTFPEQKLRSIIAGAIFHDGIGLSALRDRFKYFPRDVWLYLLGAGWTRIGQEEHLMGRAGYVGDEIGSALIASRLVRDLMRLCFLMERQYAPYPKWFGTAFEQLNCAGQLTPIFRRVLTAETWRKREEALIKAYEIVATMHNDLRITDELPAKVSNFFDRPFKVIHLAGGFAEEIAARIQDPKVKLVADRSLIGSIDQFSDSTDLLSDPQWRKQLKLLYEWDRLGG